MSGKGHLVPEIPSGTGSRAGSWEVCQPWSDPPPPHPRSEAQGAKSQRGGQDPRLQEQGSLISNSDLKIGLGRGTWLWPFCFSFPLFPPCCLSGIYSNKSRCFALKSMLPLFSDEKNLGEWGSEPSCPPRVEDPRIRGPSEVPSASGEGGVRKNPAPGAAAEGSSPTLVLGWPLCLHQLGRRMQGLGRGPKTTPRGGLAVRAASESWARRAVSGCGAKTHSSRWILIQRDLSRNPCVAWGNGTA